MQDADGFLTATSKWKIQSGLGSSKGKQDDEKKYIKFTPEDYDVTTDTFHGRPLDDGALSYAISLS